MDYAQTYFGKPLTELQFTDIEHFFSEERQESDQIEFKSYNFNGSPEAKLVKVIEGITAFLNSSGGLLIWGAPEGISVVGRKEKAFVGSLTKLPLTIEKDWLISKIADKIIPLPRGFRVQLVPTSDGQVAIFEIDESPYSPHQTGNTYYMRIDGASRPAPHHYVEALFKKVAFPRLELYIKHGKPYRITSKSYGIHVRFLFFNFSPFLNEENLSFRIWLSHGKFEGDLEPDKDATKPLPTYSSDRRWCHSDVGVVAPLVYGFPFQVVEELRFQEGELPSTDRFSISIIFSGKAAPAKFCRYHIRFSPDRKEATFNIGEENQLVADLEELTGLQSGETLERFGVLRPKPSDETWMFED